MDLLRRDVQVNVILLGDSEVGKTGLIKQFVDDTIDPNYFQTVRSTFVTKGVVTSTGTHNVTMTMWDTPGHEKYRDMAVPFYRNTHGCMLVFDITNEQSFENVKGMWKDRFMQNAFPDGPDKAVAAKKSNKVPFPFVVVGNKSDMADRRNVGEAEARSWCDANQITYIETSARDDSSKIFAEAGAPPLRDGKTKVDAAFDVLAIQAAKYHDAHSSHDAVIAQDTQEADEPELEDEEDESPGVIGTLMGLLGLNVKKGIHKAGYGYSMNPDPEPAVKEAIDNARVSNPTIAFITCTKPHDPENIAKKFGERLAASTRIHGCTSAMMLDPQSGLKAGVACLLIRAHESAFVTSFGQSGAEAAQRLKEKCNEEGFSVHTVMMTATPGDEEKVIQDVKKHFGANTPVFGASAADDSLHMLGHQSGSTGAYSRDWKVFTDQRPYYVSKGVSLVGITREGGVRVGAAMLGASVPSDKTATVTSAEGRKVMSIDDQPALNWVIQWLSKDVLDKYTKKEKGEDDGDLDNDSFVKFMARKPVGIEMGDGKYVTSHLVSVDHNDDSIEFLTPVEADSTLTIMDYADGPPSQHGFSSTWTKAFDTANACTDIHHPKACLMYFDAGLAVAAGPNSLPATLTTKVKEKVGNLGVLGMAVYGEQGALNGYDGPKGTATPKSGGKGGGSKRGSMQGWEANNAQLNLSMGMILLE